MIRALFALFLALLLPAGEAFALNLPLPAGLQYPISVQDNPLRIMDAFCGIPYRADGGINEAGRYVYFARPEVMQSGPGLNCSGFVLGASRFILKSNISIAKANTDRLGDSGADSPYGQDWDYGWDIIMNISDSLPHRLILPGYVTKDVEGSDGFTYKGFDMHAKETWPELKARLKTGKLYLASFNRETTKKGYKMMHYHVGIIYVDAKGEMWLYQGTTQHKSIYKRSLSGAKNLGRFLKDFANTGNVRKHMLILEVDIPA